MITLNRVEMRSLATATVLVLAGTGLRLGIGPGPADTGWGPPPDLESSSISAGELRTAVEEAVQRENRAGTPLAAGERIDPNFADETELRRLPGIGPTKATAIVRERRENGPFGALEDLERVTGLGEKTIERLAPHIALTSVSDARRTVGGRIDLNQATLEDLTRLPGIGLSLAGRIIEFRRRNGRFREIDDLLSVPGIGPATVEKIRNRVQIR